MSTMETLQLRLLDNTTKRRHAREAHCCEFREAGPEDYCRPSGAALAVAWCVLCAAASLFGGVVAFFIFR